MEILDGPVMNMIQSTLDIPNTESTILYQIIYSQTSMARTPLEP